MFIHNMKISINTLVQDVSAPGGELKSHAFKSHSLLNPLPTNDWTLDLLYRGYKMCKLRV